MLYLDRDRLNPPAPDATLSLDTTAQDWLSLKRWQREFLVARSFCDRDLPAALRAHVSVPIVLKECKRNPAFAAARELAIARTLVLGMDVATQHARDNATPLVDHAIAMATNTDRQTGEPMREPIVNKEGNVVGYRDKVAPRDQATFTRIVLEGAGLNDRAGQGGNTYVQNVAAYWAGQPLPPPLSGTPAIDVRPEPEDDTPRVKRDDAE